MGTPPPLFTFKDVGFTFSGESTALFRDLTFQIAPKERFAILGPSGSGKSTLLKLLAGLLRPTSGSAHFEGMALASLSAKQRGKYSRRIGMTFQKAGLFDSLSCGENLSFPLEEAGSPKYRGRQGRSARQTRVRQALKEVGLEGGSSLRLSELSGGMQKRLGIARALVLEPEVVLYDDPTAGLDPITARAITDLITSVGKKHSMTLILVTNDPGQAFRLCDRVGFLYGGSFLEIGTPDAVEKSKHPVVNQFVHGLKEGPLTL